MSTCIKVIENVERLKQKLGISLFLLFQILRERKATLKSDGNLYNFSSPLWKIYLIKHVLAYISLITSKTIQRVFFFFRTLRMFQTNRIFLGLRNLRPFFSLFYLIKSLTRDDNCWSNFLINLLNAN